MTRSVHLSLLLAVIASAQDSLGSEAEYGASFLLQTSVVSVDSNWTETLMAQLEKRWTTGFWAQRNPSTTEECGQSTFRELQVTIPKWQQEHPGVDGFCYFENQAMWFHGAGTRSYYGNPALHLGRKAFVSTMCDGTGELSSSGAPSVAFSYDGGRFAWTHVRNCIDIVDDPYCYSLGWLKGQGSWDEALTKNITRWEQRAEQECERLQEEFHFDDEEVTVGKHVFSTPLYFRRTLNSLRGRGMPIDRRMHAEHVYSKCQLGGARGAATEMAYCFYKACVLPGNRIGHYDECGYEAK
mmetsp:Transcript_71929/g.166509  ORF Transcript_71929/g.166509 Transcript_71929/m.166509 type:complete len:297 (+) Transcript_71929:86-976(+)